MTDYPRKWEDLTPEQQQAMREFWQQLAANMRKMTETFAEIVTACTAAVRTIEPVDEPEPTLPTTIGSTVLVRGMGGNRIALQLRPDTRGRVGWLHAHGNPWIKPIVRDHLITVLFDAGETEPPEPGDAPT